MMLPRICFTIYYYSGSRCRIVSSNIAFRYVRSIAKRPRIDPIQTLEGKVKTEYESKLDEDFFHSSELKDLKRMYRQVFVNTDETQTEAEFDLEEDFDAPIEHAEKFYEMNLQEEKAHKSMVKKNIIKNKYFKPPLETNLLTHAAKMQIRHLYQLDPVKWTPEILAESFPISVTGVKKLLKSNYRLNVEEKIKKHDAEVVRIWKLLESGNTETISPVTVQLYRKGKLSKDHHAGNFNIPLPAVEVETVKSKPKKIGEHAAMINYYLDLKNKAANIKDVSLVSKNTDVKLADGKNEKLLQVEQRDIQKTVLPEFKSRYPTRTEMENMQAASYLAAEEPDEDEIEIPQSQFEQNLLQELSERPSKSRSSVDDAYEEWLQKQISEKSESSAKKPQPFDTRDFFETVKKYSGDAIELHVDKGSAFLYDANLGYQQPFGTDVIQRRIRIPKDKYVPGALYRVGKNFYADNGEFLFKVFV